MKDNWDAKQISHFEAAYLCVRIREIVSDTDTPLIGGADNELFIELDKALKLCIQEPFDDNYYFADYLLSHGQCKQFINTVIMKTIGWCLSVHSSQFHKIDQLVILLAEYVLRKDSFFDESPFSALASFLGGGDAFRSVANTVTGDFLARKKINFAKSHKLPRGFLGQQEKMSSVLGFAEANGSFAVELHHNTLPNEYRFYFDNDDDLMLFRITYPHGTVPFKQVLQDPFSLAK